MEKKRAFFYKIDVVDLMDFATDPEGSGMTLLQFAKELNKGESSISYIQKVIDEAHGYMAKKSEDSRKAGIASALRRQQKSTAVEHPLTVVERIATDGNEVQPISSNSNNSSTTTEQKKESKSSRFTPPTIEEAREYFLHLNAFDEAEAFYHHHNSRGWKVSGRSMVNWQSAIVTWIKNDFKGNQSRHKSPPPLELVKDHRRYL